MARKIKRVVGVYKIIEEVDTNSKSFKEFADTERRWSSKLTEEQLTIAYAQRSANWNIIDDDGHGTLTAYSFDWEIEKS